MNMVVEKHINITIRISDFEAELLWYYINNTKSTFRSYIDTSILKAQLDFVDSLQSKLQEELQLPLV